MLHFILLLCFQEMNLKAEDIYLRKPEFLEARGIEFWTEKEVPEQLGSILMGRVKPPWMELWEVGERT